MAIIRQKNSRNGIEYVFLSVSKRVPDKKWPVSERTSLGHFDLAGDFVPSRHFLALDEQQQLATGLIDEPYIRKRKETSLLVRKRCGFELLFYHAARRTHVDKILRAVFPSDWKAFLSLVFFNLAEPDLPMYRFNRFDRNNLHPYGQNVHKDMITELLRLVDEQARSSTFEMLRKANSKEGARLLALDSTSIAALGELLYRASRGYSKEGLRDEEQLELLTVYDLRTRIPVYYRTLEGKIADVATLENTARDLERDGMEAKHVVFVMDRGYYSDTNVRHLLKARYKFVCAVDIRRHAFVNESVRSKGPSVLCADNYIQDKDLYCARFWHSIDIPRRGRGENRMNLALDICFNPDRAKREQQLLSRKIAKMRAALERGQATLEPNSEYSRFFTAVEEKVYGQGTVTSFVVRTDQEQRERSLCGYFAYLSDGSLSTREVVDAYAQRMMIECSFKNFKERYNRPMHSDDQGVDGEIYVTFLTVVLESWIRERMKEKKLNEKYTMRSLFDEIEGIECSFCADKPKDRTYSEITNKAGMILYQMGIDIPNECWPVKVRDQIAKEQRETEKASKDEGKEVPKSA
jgi:hypothetical protein